MATNSSVLARVIADGFRRDASGKPLALRVSLALMPDLRGKTGGPLVDLENWCWDVYNLRNDLKLFAGTDPSADHLTEVKWYARGNLGGDPGPKDGPLAKEFNDARAKAANVLWRRIFLADCGALAQFGWLATALKESQKPTGGLKFTPDKRLDAVEGNPMSYSVATLAQGVEGLYWSQTVATLLATAGQLTIDGKREAWDVARPLTSPKFFETLNTNLFGVFSPDTLTNRVLQQNSENSRWWPKEGEVPSDEVHAAVTLVGKTLETASPATKGLELANGAGVKNYVSQSFVRFFGEQLATEKSYNLKVAQFTLDLDTAIKQSLGGITPTVVPDAAPLKRDANEGELGGYFAHLAVDPGPWMRGYFSPMPEEPGISPKDRAEREKTAAAAREDDEAKLQRAVAAYHAAWRPDTPAAGAAPRGDAACGGQTDVEIARRKFLGILNRPSLAKFLGLIIDVELKLDSLPYAAGKCFWIMADFGSGAEKDRRVWTATMLAPDTGAGTPDGFFGPCTKLEAAQALNVRIQGFSKDDNPLAYERGVFNLAAPGKDGKPRFTLIDFDIDAAVQALENTGHSRTTSRQKGALDGEIKVALPNLRTRGIALIDRDRTKEIVAEIAEAQAKGGDGPVRLYADDLVIGYRVDVGLCKTGTVAVPPLPRWRTLTDREVQYDPKEIKKEYAEWLRHDVERENGFIKPTTRAVINADKDNNDSKQFVPQETVAVWTGGSLALGTGDRPPAIAEKLENETDEHYRKRVWELPNKEDQLYPITEIDAYCELGANLGFAMAKEPAEGGGLPPLRFCHRYWLGARLVYANGGGISLPTAAQFFYTRPPDNHGKPRTTAVGDKKGAEGFLYARGERAGAPVVLLPPDDPLVQLKPSELHGERAMTLVLRGAPAHGVRYLVPPRSIFDVAEAHGQFDRLDAQHPPGAFIAYQRDRESGEFPNARQKAGNKKGGENPGQVLRPGDSKDAAPFYPDPLARECYVRVLQHDAPSGEKDECKRLDFYEKAGDAIQKARPVRIMVRTFSPPPGQPLHKITLLDKEEPATLLVELAAASDLDLLLWSGTDEEACLTALRPAVSGWNALAELPARLKDQLKRDATSRGEISELAAALANVIEFFEKPAAVRTAELHAGKKPLVELLRKQCGPLPTIADQRRLRVVRPVKSPIEAPRLKKADPKCGGLAEVIASKEPAALHAVRVLPIPAPADIGAGATQAPDNWAAYVAKQAAPDPLCYQSEPGANQTFFVGTAQVHRASTGKLRFEATWREYKDDVELQEDGTYAHVPGRAGPGIFSIGKIVREAKGGLSDLDLLWDETGALRGLKIDFPDTKARHLTITLHGVSRFTEFYEPAKVPAEAKKDEPNPADFEKHDPKHDVTLWVPSTARPAAPVVDRILPVFRWSTDAPKDKIIVTRDVDLRVYLKRPWHSSGEGERLGVICWPPNLFSDATADEVARCTLLDRKAPNVVNPKEEFLTRWGADPIHLSGDLSDLIPADQFASAELRVPDLPLELPHRDADLPGGTPQLDIDKGCPNDPPDPTRPRKTRDAAPDSVNVAIVAYTPKLDAQRGDTWYCDLPITAGDAYFPFIRLGLSRYQPNSSQAKLALSYPVAEWAQIPPQRKASLQFTGSRKILVTVTGTGYHQSQGDELPNERHLIDRPRLRIRVCRAVLPDRIPEHQPEINYLPLVVGGKPLDYPKLVPYLSGNTVTWMQEITLPQTEGVERYAVIVEETEVMIGDADVIGDVMTTDRGPMFACTIPFSAPYQMGSVPEDAKQGTEEEFTLVAPAGS
jgi:hypothetical protein